MPSRKAPGAVPGIGLRPTHVRHSPFDARPDQPPNALPPLEDIDAWLAELESGGYVEPRGEKPAAADSIREVLEEPLSALGATAREMWEDYAGQVAVVTRPCRTVSQAASPEHLVVVVHRE